MSTSVSGDLTAVINSTGASQDVLARKLSPSRGDAVFKALQALLVRAQYVPIRYSYRPASPDPGDDLVIDCVLNSQSLLITSNVRDFQETARRWGFAVLRPPEFLRALKETKQS